MAISYRIHGVDRLIADLTSDISKFEDFTEAVVRDVSMFVENKAKRYSPVDTGKLRASIQRVKLTRFSQQVQTGTEYARYVEYGTSDRREQSYMRIAGDEAQGLMHRFIIKGLKRYL